MMAVANFLQLRHDLGGLNYGHHSQFQSMLGKGELRLLSVTLSSHGSWQDPWSLQLSASVHMLTHSTPSKHNVFICNSFLLPGQVKEIPILKNAAIHLMRPFNVFHGSPLLVQLVPAVGIIAFALWGLVPLMRQSRKMFFNKSDNSWKRSSTHYVTTSYLQPFLLWTGATLICRTLDPVVLPTQASQAVKQRFVNFVGSLSTVLAFAYCLSSLIQHAQKFFVETNESSDTRNMGFQFAGKAVYSAVWVAAVSLFMELLGFSTQKWITAGGLGTVLLTLAGREILTNFLASVIIHATRPFVVNEWIQTKIEGEEVSGTVEHVGWWSPTIIRGDDREAVHIPNHQFTMNVVRNLSHKTHWRVKTHLAISHLDVNKINSIVADMRKVLAKNPQVEQQRLHRRVFLDNIDPENQSLLILVSCFVKTPHSEEYHSVKEALLLDLLRVISHHRARLATPIRTVQKMYRDANMEDVPFSEAFFTRARGTIRRPLLIEPPNRVNGDDGIKTQAGPTRRNEEQNADTAADETLMPDKKQEKGSLEDKDILVGSSFENPSATLLNTGSEKEESEPPETSNLKQNDEKLPEIPSPVSMPTLEENIVLGVALEGSKRTLPIEEDMNANESSWKDMREGQAWAVTGSATVDDQ